jgi:predicted DNA-binding transcriptional regulator AlpA
MTPYLTRQQVQELVQVSAKTLNKLIVEGVIPPPFKVGGVDRWDATEVAAAVEKTRKEPAA